MRPNGSNSFRGVAGLLAALAAGAFVLFWKLADHSLFVDEAFSLHIASFPFPAMMQLIVHDDAHPPLFYVLSHYLIMLVHVPAERYRWFTAPCGLITIAATWAIARRFFGDAGATAAALLTALAPGLLDADREYRMYAPLAMLAAVSWWCLLAAEDAKQRRERLAWIGYGACAIALPYVQYLGGLTVAAQCIYAAFDIRKRWPVFAASALSLMAFAPWVGALAVQFAQGGHAVGPDFDPMLVPQATVFASAPVSWTTQPLFVRFADFAVVAIVLGGAWVARRSALPFMLSAVALQLALALALHKSLMIPRYLDVYVPLFALCAAAPVAALAATRFRVGGLALAAAIAAAFAICDADMLLDPVYQRTDWYLLNNHVATLEKPADAMLFVQGYPVLVVGTYPAFAAHEWNAPANASMLPQSLAWIDAHAHRRIWYIENQYWFADPQRSLLASLLAQRRVLDRWGEPRADAADAASVILFDAVSPREPVRKREPGHGIPGLSAREHGH